jgi:universal stress protein A
MAFRRILLPVDFSDFSDVALERTSKLIAGHEEREVHFLFVLHTPTDTSTWSGDPDAEMQQRLEELVRDFQPRLPGQTKATVCKGHPSTEICRYAASHECDLIVMATHGRTGLKHMLLGSTAEQVVRHAPCAVLTLRVRPD